MKHTPGPWAASNAFGGGTAIWIAPQDGPNMVLQGADCLRSDSIKYEQISVDQLAANATLIAAAPDLLALCETCLRVLYEEDHPALRQQLREAISKATGEQA